MSTIQAYTLVYYKCHVPTTKSVSPRFHNDILHVARRVKYYRFTCLDELRGRALKLPTLVHKSRPSPEHIFVWRRQETSCVYTVSTKGGNMPNIQTYILNKRFIWLFLLYSFHMLKKFN